MNTHRVGIVLFNDVEVLDFCGPFEVFSVVRFASDVREASLPQASGKAQAPRDENGGVSNGIHVSPMPQGNTRRFTGARVAKDDQQLVLGFGRIEASHGEDSRTRFRPHLSTTYRGDGGIQELLDFICGAKKWPAQD
jgi:hypothetical protein